MQLLDAMEDDDLKDIVNKFISSLLPHENYSAEFFIENLETIFKYVKLEEFSLSYRIMLEALNDVGKIRNSLPDYEPKFTRKIFEDLLSVSIGEAVIRPEIKITEYLQDNGLDYDLKREEVFDKACQVLYGLCMELYDTCFELAEPSDSVMNSEPSLRAAMADCAAHQAVSIQNNILRCNGTRIGKRVMNGFKDWLEFTTLATSDINARLQTAEQGSAVTLDSLQQARKMLNSLNELREPIANWGIPELDDFTPILKHRLVVVVGKENVGKTKFCVDEASNVLLAGGRVAYMCGESIAASVFADILINYIWKRYGLIVNQNHIANPNDCPVEDVRKVIGMSIDELMTGGKLTFVDSFNYKTLYQEMQSTYERCKFDFLVIDHSCALSGSMGSLKENIDQLAVMTREFKKQHPVCILVSSHPSTSAREALIRGNPVTDSATKGSSGLSGEADEIFLLRNNETLDKQGLLEMEVLKRRNADVILNRIVLKKKFEVSALIYDENAQAVDKIASLEKQEALNALMNDVNSEEYSLV